MNCIGIIPSAVIGEVFFSAGFGGYPSHPLLNEKIIQETDTDGSHADDDPHLGSTYRVTDYHAHATDGDIGHVKDFIFVRLG